MKRLMFWVLAGFGQLAGAADVGAQPLQRFTANYGPGCHIAASLPPSLDGGLGSDPNTGRGGTAVNPIPRSWKSSLDALGFGLYCKPSEGPGSMQTFGVFDRTQSRWVKNVEVMRQQLLTSGDLYQIELAEQIIQTTQIHDIRAVNAQGWAETFEDLTGNEAHRERRMNFCVFNPPTAVCGIGTVAYLADGPKGDLTPHALKIIRSIEFLPDEPPLQLQGSTAPVPNTEAPAADVKP